MWLWCTRSHALLRQFHERKLSCVRVCALSSFRECVYSRVCVCSVRCVRVCVSVWRVFVCACVCVCICGWYFSLCSTYGQMLSHALHAQRQVACWSGKGVIHNYGACFMSFKHTQNPPPPPSPLPLFLFGLSAPSHCVCVRVLLYVFVSV